MTRLTRQERNVLCVIIGFLLLGWMVKTYRLSHPPPMTVPVTP